MDSRATSRGVDVYISTLLGRFLECCSRSQRSERESEEGRGEHEERDWFWNSVAGEAGRGAGADVCFAEVGSPEVVVGVCVDCAEADAPRNVVGRVGGFVTVEVAG